jgi:hypothetical protein
MTVKSFFEAIDNNNFVNTPEGVSVGEHELVTDFGVDALNLAYKAFNSESHIATESWRTVEYNTVTEYFTYTTRDSEYFR